MAVCFPYPLYCSSLLYLLLLHCIFIRFPTKTGFFPSTEKAKYGAVICKGTVHLVRMQNVLKN